MSEPAREVDELLGALLDRSITSEQMARLGTLIRTDRSIADRAAELMLVSSDLAEHTQRRDSSAAPAAIPFRPAPSAAKARNPRTLYALAAALLLAGCGVAIVALVLGRRPAPIDDQRPTPSLLASVTDIVDGTLLIDGQITRPGSDYAGRSVSLDAGEAEFMLAQQVVVRLRGRSELSIHNPMSATLERGSATFDCPHGAKGYTVHLPGGASVVDLGTRFTVVVGPSGRSVVKVTQGVVRADGTAGPSRRIDENQIARFDAAGRLLSVAGEWTIIEDSGPDDVQTRWSDLMEQVRLDDALAALYRFDFDPATEPTALANDAPAGEVFDAALHGATPVPGRLPGKGALRFGGPGQYVSLAVPDPLGSFAIAAWVRRDGPASHGVGAIVATDNWVNGCIAIDANNDGLVRFVLRGVPEPTIVQAPGALATIGRWTHLVAVYDADAGVARLYVDGRLAAEAPQPTGLRFSLASARIGNWLPHPVNTIRPFPGAIDELVVLRRALTDHEAHALCRGGAPPDESPSEAAPQANHPSSGDLR